MWPIILSLILAGLLMLCVEVFIPGMVVGLAGMAALVAAVVICYIHYGQSAGNFLLAAELVGGIAFFVVWLKYVPRTALARHWTLTDSLAAQSQEPPAHELLNKVGESLTTLRPAGTARIGDQRLDVVTRGELIERGAAVEIIKIEGHRIVVRQVEPAPKVSA